MNLLKVHYMKETRRYWLNALLNSPRYMGDRSAFCKDAGITNGRLSQLLDPREAFGDVAANKLTDKLNLHSDYFTRGVPSPKPQEKISAEQKSEPVPTPSDPINIHRDRRAPQIAQDVVAALGSLLKNMEPKAAKTVAGLLADFAQSPGDEWIIGVLTKALEPAAFALEKQKYG